MSTKRDTMVVALYYLAESYVKHNALKQCLFHTKKKKVSATLGRQSPIATVSKTGIIPSWHHV